MRKKMSGRCSAKNMDLIYNIRYTEPAVFDLNKILLYLTGYNSYNIIDRFQKEIENRFESIKYHPYICQVVFEQHGYKYHKIIIKNYVFIYTIDEENSVVNIMRIFHELEDYENKFGK